MSLIYVLVPFFSWFVTGCIKFIINSYLNGRLSFDCIGYGGMPSNHTAILSSALSIIFIVSGRNVEVLVLGVAILFIVVLDATSLRQQIGKHANRINALMKHELHKESDLLRERVGHKKIEIVAGVLSGFASAYLFHFLVVYFDLTL